MKNLAKIIAMTIFMLLISVHLFAAEKETDWKAFSENLSNCLCQCNLGVKLAALQHIITYSDNLDMDDAVFDIMCLYRSHENEKVRQLALTALYKIDNAWAIDFLGRHYKYEKSDVLKSQIMHILHDHQVKVAKKKEGKTETILAENTK